MTEFIKKQTFILSQENLKPYIKFIKFAFVGGLATIADISVYYLFFNVLKVNYILANIPSFSVGLFISYFMSRKWVFEQENHNFKRDFTLFTFTSLIGLLISCLVLFVLIDCHILENALKTIDLRDKSFIVMTAKFIASLVVLIWNFFSKNFIVFKKVNI